MLLKQKHQACSWRVQFLECFLLFALLQGQALHAAKMDISFDAPSTSTRTGSFFVPPPPEDGPAFDPFLFQSQLTQSQSTRVPHSIAASSKGGPTTPRINPHCLRSALCSLTSAVQCMCFNVVSVLTHLQSSRVALLVPSNLRSKWPTMTTMPSVEVEDCRRCLGPQHSWNLGQHCLPLRTTD